MNTEVIRLGKGIVIPSSHDTSSIMTITSSKLINLLKNKAQEGYYYEGCGEDNCGKGEGREKSFLQRIGVPTHNNGSFDDLDLGYHNGYVMFSNIEANKETLNKLLNVDGDTVKDVILTAASQGIATQNSLPVTDINSFEKLLDNNIPSELLSAEPTEENIINTLKTGEDIMWSNYDIYTGGPEGTLSHYAKQATQLRRQNLRDKLSKGGLAFIGDGHIPELLIDFPDDTEILGNLETVKDDKLNEEILRIKKVMGIIH